MLLDMVKKALKPVYMSRMLYLKTILLPFCAIMVINGCALDSRAKRKDREGAIRDVAEIVKKYDCPAACAALKAYIKSQIGEAIK